MEKKAAIYGSSTFSVRDLNRIMLDFRTVIMSKRPSHFTFVSRLFAMASLFCSAAFGWRCGCG
jgi:hypothetical protein